MMKTTNTQQTADQTADQFTADQDRFLLAALAHVSFDGWTKGLLQTTADEIGVDHKPLFPKGILDLILHFSDWADRQMIIRLEQEATADMGFTAKITAGVRLRLEVLEPFKDQLSQSLHYMALPPRGFYMPKMVWSTADKLWWWAGDNSTDYNHYTKRGLLSGVISSTTLYWLRDNSENHDQSWAFLDRRIAQVLEIGKCVGRFKKAS